MPRYGRRSRRRARSVGRKRRRRRSVSRRRRRSGARGLAKRALRLASRMQPDTQICTAPQNALPKAISTTGPTEWGGVSTHADIPTATSAYYDQSEETAALWAADVAANGHDADALVITGDDADPAVAQISTGVGRSRAWRIALDYLDNSDIDGAMLGTDGRCKCRLINTTFDYKGYLVPRVESESGDSDLIYWDDAWYEATFWLVISRSASSDMGGTYLPGASDVFDHDGTSGFVNAKAAKRYRIKKVKTIRYTKDSPYKHIRFNLRWPKSSMHEYHSANHGATAYFRPTLGRRACLFMKVSYNYRPSVISTWTTVKTHMQMRTSFKQIPG